MSAELVYVRAATLPPHSTRRDKLQRRRCEALKTLEQALVDDGIINEYAGQNGYTAIHRLLIAVEERSMDIESYLENQIRKLRDQLERTLANDAFADADARAAVVSTLHAHDRVRFDARTYSQIERTLIEHYRRLKANDRHMLRLLLDRLSRDAASDSEEGA